MKATLEEKFNIIALLLSNSILFVLEWIACFLMFVENKWKCFMFYTDIANAFALVVSGITIVSAIVALAKNKPHIPKWVQVIKFVSTTMLLITITIVVAFLAPCFGFNGYLVFLFGGTMLFTHTICPLYALIGSVVLERGSYYHFKITSFVILPTLLYGIIMLVLNIFKVVVGPYPFFMVYNFNWFITTIWCVGVIIWSYLMSVLLWVCQTHKKRVVTNWREPQFFIAK